LNRFRPRFAGVAQGEIVIYAQAAAPDCLATIIAIEM
jgi:hypothetical protein